MTNLSQELEVFKDIYKTQIEELVRQTNSQFRKISYPGSETTINIVEKGTKIVLIQNETDVSYKNHFILDIGFDEIKDMYKYHDFDMFESFNKLITHEYLHMLMGHLNEMVLEDVYAFSKGWNHSYTFAKSPFFVKNKKQMSRRDPNFKIKFKKEFDHKIMNIAGDFVINEMLNINAPFLRASSYGLIEGLSVEEYYSILYHVLKKDKNDLSQSNYLKDYYSYMKDKLEDLYNKMEEFNHFEVSQGSTFNGRKMDEVLQKEIEKSKWGNLPGKLPGMIQKMNIKQGGVWKEFRDILEEIKKKEKDFKLSLVDKENNWHRFNNRKESNNYLIYPGKIDKMGAIERKFQPSSVMFVDVSGSMSSVIEPLFTLCYLLLSKLNITLVFYDTEIKKIFSNNDKFQLEPFIAGGTDFQKAYNEYLDKYKRVNNVYVITDGYDSTLNNFPKADIWLLRNNKIRKHRNGESLWGF